MRKLLRKRRKCFCKNVKGSKVHIIEFFTPDFILLVYFACHSEQFGYPSIQTRVVKCFTQLVNNRPPVDTTAGVSIMDEAARGRAAAAA